MNQSKSPKKFPFFSFYQTICFFCRKTTLGGWLAKVLLGPKYGHSASHKIRRLSRDVVAEMVMQANDAAAGSKVSKPHLSRVVVAGIDGTGKHEIIRNFKNIGQEVNSPDDVLSNATSLSDSDDMEWLMAFEYNEHTVLIDFIFADNEQQFFEIVNQDDDVDLIVATFSVCSTESLDFCVNIMDQLRNGGYTIPLALVGNKTDLVVARVVSKNESRCVAKNYGITLLEVSAMLGDKCPELLLGILRQLTSKHSSVSRQSSGASPASATTHQDSDRSVTRSKSNSHFWSRLTKTFSNR